MPVTRAGTEYGTGGGIQFKRPANTVAASAKITSSLASKGQLLVASLVGGAVSGLFLQRVWDQLPIQCYPTPLYSVLSNNAFMLGIPGAIVSFLVIENLTDEFCEAFLTGAAVGTTCVAVNELFKRYVIATQYPYTSY